MAKERYLPFIDNWIYFGHLWLDKYAVIPSYPDQIDDNMGSNFATTDALSRSAPVFTYSNSGPRSVGITLQLHRDMMDDVNVNVSNLKSNVLDFKDEDYVDTLIKYLQACAVPKYSLYSSGAKAVEPPWVAIKFGESVFIKGVINTTISVTYHKPILADHKYALVSVSFTVAETDPYDASQIAKDGSFRGITKTFKSGIYRS